MNKESWKGDRDGSMQKGEMPILLSKLDFVTNKKMTKSYPAAEQA